MRNSILVLIGTLSLSVLPTAPAAQEAPPAQNWQGFWIEFGSGPGYAQLDCSGCGPGLGNDPFEGGAGVALHLAAGVSPRPNLLVGGELNGYTRWRDGGASPEGAHAVFNPAEDRKAFLGAVALTARYSPLPDSPLFVKAGAGVGGYSLVVGTRFIYAGREHLSVHTVQTRAGALQAGAGYKVNVGHGAAIVPTVNVTQLLTGNVERDFGNQRVTAPGNPRYLLLGLAFHLF